MGTYISLPNGKSIDSDELISYSIRQRDAREFLANPEILLKHPRKDSHYGWPLRDERTAGLLRGGMYRRVRPSELRTDCPYEVRTQEGVGGVEESGESGQVEWFNHMLVEINDEFWRDQFEAPAWRSSLILAQQGEAIAEAAKKAVPGVPLEAKYTSTKR